MTPIIVAMRAPLLSATSSLDRICTIRSTIYSRMILELFLDDFPELRMWHARDRLYYNRFVHSARKHFAGAGLPRTAGHGRRERRRLSSRSLMLFGHKI